MAKNKSVPNARRDFWAVFTLPFSWTILFLIIPYATLVVISFWTRQFPTFLPDFQFGNYIKLFSDPQYSEVLIRTLKISGLTSISSIVLAYPLTYFIVFNVKSPSARNALYFAVIVPLWVSYLLRAYTWKLILGYDGALNSMLMWLGILDEPLDIFLYNQAAMVITLTYIFIPFMVMPLYTSLERIPKNLLEASGDLGAGSFETFIRITLPLSLSGLIAGATMTFCLAFGDFVAPVLVGGPDGTMVATVLQSQFGAALNWPLGSALAVVILTLVILILSISSRFDSSSRVNFS